MSEFADDPRQRRAPSLLTLARHANQYDDDAVARHSAARAMRESHVHAMTPEPAEDLTSAEQPAPVMPPEVADRDETVRGIFARWRARRDEEAALEEPQPLVSETPDLPPQSDPVAFAHSETMADEAPQDLESVSTGTRRTILATTLTGAAMGAALAFAWPSAYVAKSEILIDSRTAQGSGSPFVSDPSAAFIDNQLRVLRSSTVLGTVAERLDLSADAEFNGTASGPFGIGALLSNVGNLMSGADASAAADQRRRVIDTLARAVEAERLGGSTAIAVSVGTSDAAKSALIANTISEVFVGRSAGAGAVSASLEEARAAVEQAERAVETYKRENGLVDAQGRLITDGEILRVGEQLSAARGRTVELNARAASTRDADVDSIVTGSLPEQYASPTLADMRSRHAELKQQLERTSVKLGPRHPERLAVEAELEGARQDIAGELRRVAASLQTELRRAVQQEQDLAAQLAQMKVRQGEIGGELVRLRELERDAEAQRAAFEQVRVAQAGGSTLGADGATILSRAEPPLEAAGSSLPVFSMVGALAGLLGGFALTGSRWRRTDDADADELSRENLSHEDVNAAHSARETETEPLANAADDQNISANEEADPMSAYPHNDQPHVPPHQQPQPAPAALYPQQPAHVGYAQQAAAPVYAQPLHPSQQPMAPQQAYGWPMQQPAAAHYGGYPQAPQPVWPAMPQHMMPQFMAQPLAHDPWAHLRGYAPHFAAPAYAAAPHFPAATMPQQPYQAVPLHAPEPQHHAPLAPQARDETYDQDAFVDDRTNAAIEEIRQSLREFREAIEDFAESRDPQRRFGT
jgi:succinoglycan biosynthesis transport protein ExoP